MKRIARFVWLVVQPLLYMLCVIAVVGCFCGLLIYAFGDWTPLAIVGGCLLFVFILAFFFIRSCWRESAKEAKR